MKVSVPPKVWQWLLLFVTLVAVVERFSIYLDARSLMIDEANLAFNIVDRSYAGLFHNLDHAQYAPPLFSVSVKAAVAVIGVNEYALRLIPLLASIAALLSLIAVGRKLLATPYLLWTIALIGFSWYFLRYGTEIKQYASDTWLALAVVFWALHWPWSTMRTARWLLWAMGGAVLVWASMPIVFVLAGVGLYYGWGWWQQREAKALLPLAGTVGLWLASFGAYYFTILSTDIGSEYLQAYHMPFFFDPMVTSMAEIKAQYYLFQNLLATALPKWLPILGLIVLVGVWGTVVMAKRQLGAALLLLTPLVLTLVASALHLYTLIPRVSLFMVPFMVLLIAYGAQDILQRLPHYGQWAGGIVLALIASLQMNITFLWQPMYIDPLKPAIAFIQDTAPEVPVIVHYEAVPSYRFYAEYHDQAEEYRLSHPTLTEWGALKPAMDTHLSSADSFWLLIAHTPQEEVQVLLESLPKPLHLFELERGYAYLFSTP